MKIKRFLRLFLIFILLLILVPKLAFAHQPRLVKDNIITTIKNPAVSQAFYGELKGQPAVFRLQTDKELSLYIGLLVPDLPQINKDYSVLAVKDQGETAQVVFSMDGQDFSWTPFYEEFAGDNYWQGPDKKQVVSSGDYLIKVYSPTNSGKYVLVVGEKEAFPPLEILKTFITLPQIKSNFFNKPAWSAFTSKIGLYMIGGLVIIILLIVAIVILWRRYRKHHLSHKMKRLN